MDNKKANVITYFNFLQNDLAWNKVYIDFESWGLDLRLRGICMILASRSRLFPGLGS